VHLHPTDIGVLADPDCFDLSDFHLSNPRGISLMPLDGSSGSPALGPSERIM
jgi:hypothetical protein